MKRTISVQKDGSFDNIANVSIITDNMKSKGLVLWRQKGNLFLVLRSLIGNIFNPKKLSETDFRVTDETVAVHMSPQLVIGTGA